MLAFAFIVSSIFVAAKCQLLKKEPLIIVPDSFVIGANNEILVCTSADATVKILIKEKLSTLYQKVIVVPRDLPIKITVPPLEPVLTYLLTVDIIWNGGFVDHVSKTFHIPSASNVHLLQTETDKPQYRPSEEVKIRILPLSRNYSVSSTKMSLIVKNAQGLKILNQKVAASSKSAFAVTRFKLPYHQATGKWEIIIEDEMKAIMDRKYFEVEEYTLANFQVALLSDKSTFDNLNETFRFVVLARFPVGPLVSGALTIKCGTKQILYSQMVKGQFSFAFQLNQCLLEHQLVSTVNQLLIVAEVRDYGSGEKNTDTLKLYKNSNVFSVTTTPLKPGLTSDRPFPLKITVVSNQNQNIKNLSLVVIPTCIKSRHQRIARTVNSLSDKTDNNGEIIFHIPINANCLALMLEVSFADQRLNSDPNNRVTFLYPKIFDNSEGVILLRKHYFTVGEQIEAVLLTTKYSINTRRFNLLIACSSGYNHHETIFNNTISVMTIVEMIPECFLSLYAIRDNGEITLEDVSKIFLTDSCNEVSIRTTSDDVVFRPRQNVSFLFRGSPNGASAITAVDQKLEFLFNNHYQKIKPSVVKERRDMYNYLFETKTGEKFYFDNLRQRLNESINSCCMAGQIWWQMQKSCPILDSALSVRFLQKCQEKFYGCCSSTKRPTPVPSCQQGFGPDCGGVEASYDNDIIRHSFNGQLGKSSVRYNLKTDSTSRRFFPEVWLFDELYLSSSNGHGYLTSTFPDSITNWTVYSQFFSPGQGICSKSITLSTNQEIFTYVDLPNNVFVGDQTLTKVTVVNMSPVDKNVVIVISRPAGLCTEKPWHGDRYVFVSSSSSTSLHIPFEFLDKGDITIEFTLKDGGQIVDHLVKTVHVSLKQILDETTEYGWVFNLSHPFVRGPAANEVFECNSTVSNTSAHELQTNFKLTETFRQSKIFHSALLELSVLQSATTPQHTATNRHRLKSETKYQVENSAFLNDLLRTIPILMKTVKERMHIELNDNILIESKTLLQTALVELLSFRTAVGSYSSIRNDYSKQDLWLSLVSTMIQCINGVDESIVCHSMDWIMNQQLDDGRFPSDSKGNSFMVNNNSDKTLFTSIFTIAADHCFKYCSIDLTYKTKVKKSLNFLKTVDPRQADSVILSAITLALTKWDQPSAKFYKDALFDRLEKSSETSLQYWPYKPQSTSWYEPFKHGLSSFLSSSYRKKLLANQILLNSLGILIQNEFPNDQKVDLSDVLSWIYRAQYADGSFVGAMDTFFALEAVQLEETHKQTSTIFITDATVTVYCNSAICHVVSLDSTKDEFAKIISMKASDLYNVSLVVSGTGVVSAKFRLISTLSNPFLKDYPVKIFDNSKKSINGSGQELCFSINHSSISSLSIEHGLLVEHMAQIRTFRLKVGNAIISSLELTSNSLHIQFDHLKPFTNYCYVFDTFHGPGSRLRVTKSYPITLARHNEYGIVGMKKMMHKFENAPLLEKYCSRDEQCYCLETGCPQHNGRCDSMCPDPNHVVDNSQTMFKEICRKSNYGAIIQIRSIKNETYHHSNYDYIGATVHIEFPSKELDLKEIILLKKSTCPCPYIETNRFYFLIVNNDQISRSVDEFSNVPLIVIGKHSLFEPSFTSNCTPQRQLEIMKLVEKANYDTFCRRFVN